MYDPDKYALATVVERRDVASDLWVMRIAPECPLPFRPGQYATLCLILDGRTVERPYSIASAPDEDTVELFIERVPNGELSAPLCKLPVGAEVAVRRRCKGLFLKEFPLQLEPHLFVATVTGVAPFVSAIRGQQRLAAKDVLPEGFAVTLIQGASTSAELGYVAELTRLANELPWLTYIPTISRPWEEPGWEGETGRVEDVLRKYADAAGVRPGHGGVFLCGNPQMVRNARAIMRRSGLAGKTVREEQYWPE